VIEQLQLNQGRSKTLLKSYNQTKLMRIRILL